MELKNLPYIEKIINGVLHIKSSPNGKWHIVSEELLLKRKVEELELINQKLIKIIKSCVSQLDDAGYNIHTKGIKKELFKYSTNGL